ncbi:MAG TPA: HAMP domain-containing sensor histidine kinase [Ktedonobacterales bacterium]|nr:HAMP domain-containing sensor histidine kinase [Ktedonobacterales bacterium]
MSDLAFVTPHEREIYRQYEDQRRIRLARFIALVCGVTAGLAGLILTTYLLFHLHPLDPFILLITAVAWVDLVFYGLGYVAARRGHAILAALSICGAVLLAVGILAGYILVTTGLNALSLTILFALSIVIVISGILGNTQLLVGVTTVLVLSGCVVLVANAHAPVLGHNLFVITLLFVVILSLPGALMVIFQQGYRRTLRELSDVRIAYERASALDDLKNQFIVSVNHELRNPVMAMMGHLDILDMSLASARPERLQKATQGAVRAAENLRKLLASILDASRLEQGPGEFTPERVSVVQAIQAATQLVDPNEGNLAERELRLKVPGDLSIWGESIRLQQILTNLLSNATKYSPPGTPIEVAARVVRERDPASFLRRRMAADMQRELVEITVRDWGFGIPPEQIPLLFQRFVRLPRDLASTVVGNGLGLYVCRICTEAMGGRIWVESSGVEGEGSMFHVRLPVAPESAV